MNQANRKTLFFVPMGMPIAESESKFSDVGNYRVRTTFEALNGNTIFVEFSHAPVYKGNSNELTALKLHISGYKETTKGHARADYYMKELYRCTDSYNYGKASILRFVNTYLDGDFDNVVILSRYEDYDAKTPMEHFTPNPARAKAREKAVKEAKQELRRTTGQRYPVVDVVSVDDTGMVLRDARGNTWRVEVPYTPQTREDAIQ